MFSLAKKMLNIRFEGLHSGALVVAIGTVISQLLAIVRDKLLAYFIGPGNTLDLYYASFRIPDILFLTASSLVSLSVLVPLISSSLSRSEEEAKRNIDSLYTVFFIIVVLGSGIVFCIMPYLISNIFPSFMGTDFTQLVFLSRVMLLSPIVLGISNIAGSILQAERRFAAYALSPAVYNIGIIVGVIVLFPFFGLPGLVMGVIVGTVLHLSVQIPSLWNSALAPRFAIRIDWSIVKRNMAISIPRALSLTSQQITLIVFSSFATLIGAGILSIFNLAFSLQSVPLAVIGASYSTAILPLLSRFHSEGREEDFSSALSRGLKYTFLLSIPAMVMMCFFAKPIVSVFLGGGNFDNPEIEITSRILIFFLLSTWAQSLLLVLMRAWYARGKTLLPFIAMFAGTFTSIVLAYIGIFSPGAVAENVKPFVLPISLSLGITISFFIMFLSARKSFNLSLSFFDVSSFQILLTLLLMSGLGRMIFDYFSGHLALAWLIKLVLLGVSLGLVFLASVVALFVLKNKEVTVLVSFLKGKIRPKV